MILKPILDPKIGTIRRLKSERSIGIAEYLSSGLSDLIFPILTPSWTPKWPPQTASWPSFFGSQLRLANALKNVTPHKRNRYFCWFGAFEKAYFWASKSCKNLCFFNMLLETVFFKFLYQFLGSNLGPNLGSKT